jgi:hypothetical protein
VEAASPSGAAVVSALEVPITGAEEYDLSTLSEEV